MDLSRLTANQSEVFSLLCYVRLYQETVTIYVFMVRSQSEMGKTSILSHVSLSQHLKCQLKASSLLIHYKLWIHQSTPNVNDTCWRFIQIMLNQIMLYQI